MAKYCRAALESGLPHFRCRAAKGEGLPEGPQWKQVQQLLKGVKGNSATALRAKAVLLLLTVYGLRSGEISRLLLSDFDWRLETFTVNHSKRGSIQKYPLQREVGDAILEYIRKARPQTSCRNLFLTLNPPYRSIGHSSLWRITSLRIDAAGIQCRRRGPHSLRHACATHLLEQGASLKEIGDLLGHRDSNSTRIYAKVHLQQLRRSQVRAGLRSIYLLPSGASSAVGRSASMSATCVVPDIRNYASHPAVVPLRNGYADG
jgi:integrase/recombinase XerD